MSLSYFYYETFFGSYPFDTSREIDATQATIDYLIDNGFSSAEVVKILLDIGKHDKITPDMLPDYLWNDSLLKRNQFYFHKELQLPQCSTVFSEDGEITVPQFRLEMKIKYTIEDVLNYYYNKTGYAVELRNDEKDMGALKYLLNRYANLSFMHSVDFIMNLIDYACKLSQENYDDLTYRDLLSINNTYAADTLKSVKYAVQQSLGNGYGKIIWRA